MTPAGIEPATFRFVAQRLDHCATAVPFVELYGIMLRFAILYRVESCRALTYRIVSHCITTDSVLSSSRVF